MAHDLGMPVLVADDHQTMIRIVRNLPRQIGFADVEDACDGTAALSRLKGRRYGLVISDWNMEPMTGCELLRSVRTDETPRTTPFIMISADARTGNVAAAGRAGVNGCIVEPFNGATPRARIEAVCGA